MGWAFAVALVGPVATAALGVVMGRWKRDQDRQVEQIHVLVNSRLTTALERVAALEDRLGISRTDEADWPEA